ncbi:hypothetical protein Tco_1249561, partial [Tanacetum coccineum]
MDTELVKRSEIRAKGSKTREESSSKRARDELEQEKAKKQKVDDDQEAAKMKELMKIVPDEEEVAVDAITLANKPPSIVDYKIIKEGKINNYQIIRADGGSKRYSAFIRMLRSFDREDLETLWKLVKAKHGYTRPEEGCERVLCGDLKTMFEHYVEDLVWRNLQGNKVLVWKLFDSCGVHFVRFQSLHVFMLVEKRYPLTHATIIEMLNKKLQADHWNEMLELLLDSLVYKRRPRFMLIKALERSDAGNGQKIVPILIYLVENYYKSTDHNLWDVIVNEDLEEEPAPTSGETSAPPAPKTAKQLAAKRNQKRVKSILLLAIPDEYLLKFHNVADAKSLWEAIKSRFGEVHGALISKEDINQKFLRSLPPLRNQIALIMRNKPDIDEIDIDDLYNNLRVYKDEMKRSSSSTSNSQNLAFLSSKNTNSTNEVSTASGDFRVSTAGGTSQVPSTPCAHDVAMLAVRVKKFIQRTGRNMDFKENDLFHLINQKLSAITVTEKGILLGNADLEG